MQLPSVLDSAAVMKQAVAYLEPKMERAAGSKKGTIVLATVKGDVHDIGKNLVDIILTNNGYEVINLGIKQTSGAIIDAARKHSPHAIGLSGLLVKSTLEMKYVLQDLAREQLVFPVICGGAALTRKYVEDDLRREYTNGVFYADDAFGGLHIMEDLTASEERREQRVAEGSTRKIFVRAVAAGAEASSESSTVVISTERSAAVAPAPDIPKPPFYGNRVKRDFNLSTVFQYINDTALFKNQWQLKTASQEDYARLVETKFRPIKHQLQDELIQSGILEPKAVYGYFPALRDGNSIVVYDPESSHENEKEIERFTFPRQREGRNLCISDFLMTREEAQARTSNGYDVFALALVTVGARASEETKRLFDAGDYTRYLYLHGLSVETAEAVAEYMHKHIREELGIAGEDSLRIGDLFHQKYRGSRYSFGFAACPNMEDQHQLFRLLQPEQIGVRLSSTLQMEPEQSTSAIVIHHPGAKYFSA